MKPNEQNHAHTIFVDLTAFTAFMNSSDPYYVKARTLFLDLDDLDRSLITTNYVVFDTHQWLRNSYGFQQAQFFLETIEQSVRNGNLTVISGSPEFENESKRLITDCPDLQLSLSEALTAVVMITYQIRRIFTFNPSYAFLPKMDPGIKVIPSIW
ncbi:type II toxin-antitoxin system VapC family toxin [Paenibacillus rigui]|uniref:PIN domain-containing protein n=1 Tax=Paenibacillus rigui TaxID=554312 RepID=A0A229UXS1_9BACL|nr:hypothetical protein [Paenibacillus rigui]OXM87749.1 hypothetical protein CF651_01110 [Paenibacillus rigui]